MATSNDMNTKVINSINQLHVNSIYSHTILLCLKSKPVGTQTKMCQCSYTSRPTYSPIVFYVTYS